MRGFVKCQSAQILSTSSSLKNEGGAMSKEEMEKRQKLNEAHPKPKGAGKWFIFCIIPILNIYALWKICKLLAMHQEHDDF